MGCAPSCPGLAKSPAPNERSLSAIIEVSNSVETGDALEIPTPGCKTSISQANELEASTSQSPPPVFHASSGRRDSARDDEAPPDDSTAAERLMQVVVEIAGAALWRQACRDTDLDPDDEEERPTLQAIVQQYRKAVNCPGVIPGARESLLRNLFDPGTTGLSRAEMMEALQRVVTRSRPSAHELAETRRQKEAEPEGSFSPTDADHPVDIVFCSPPDPGQDLAESLAEAWQGTGLEVASFSGVACCLKQLERAVVAARLGVVILIAQQALEAGACPFALKCVRDYGANSVVLHAPQSCPYPGLAEQPCTLQHLLRQPMTVHHSTLQYDASEVVTRLQQSWIARPSGGGPAATLPPLLEEPSSLEETRRSVLATAPPYLHQIGLAFRVFCSFAPSSGRIAAAVCGSLADYRVFCEPGCSGPPPARQSMLQLSSTLLVFASNAYLETPHLLEELRTAISLNKPIIMVAEEHFQMPGVLPKAVSLAEDRVLHRLFAERVCFRPSRLEQGVSLVRTALGPPDEELGGSSELMAVAAGPWWQEHAARLRPLSSEPPHVYRKSSSDLMRTQVPYRGSPRLAESSHDPSAGQLAH